MSMHSQRLFTRNFEFGRYIESFLISAVLAVLGIRFYLELTNYPQVGGDSLHIAHMLWGGLLMMMALLMLFSFLGRSAMAVAAVLGGLGFGTFIDEIGKFVTKDNDYFFQPAVALIYVTFILTIMLVRLVHRGQTYRQEEYLLNALREMEEVALQDLDPSEKERALRYLKRSDPDQPLVKALQDLLHRADLVPPPRPNLPARIRTWLSARYAAIVRHRGFEVFLVLFFVAMFVLRLIGVLLVVTGLWGSPVSTWPILPGADVVPGQELDFVDWAQIASSLLSGVFTVLGIMALRRSRLAAYRLFRAAILVTLLITQVFMFYEDQFAALLGLSVNGLVLIALDIMIEQEIRARG
jgi:hypothetical protein